MKTLAAKDSRIIHRLALFVITSLIEVVGLLILLAAGAHPAHAASFDLSGDCPGGVGDVGVLVNAIQLANTNGEADTIILASGCVYTLTVADNSTAGPNGLPVITSTLTLSGNGSTILRQSGSPNFRLFNVSDGGNLSLEDITLQNGLATGSSPDGQGGGIYAAGNSVLMLTSTNLVSNTAGDSGGGIYNNNVLTITDSVISHNHADMYGGGIENEDGQVWINRTSILSNTADQGGGGLDTWGEGTDTASLDHVTLQGNQSGTTGGGIWSDSDLVIVDSTLSDNLATNAGGGIDNEGLLTMTFTVLNGNAAAQGGGVFNVSMAAVLGSSLYDNRGDTGGGVWNGAIMSFTNSTLSGNTATEDGGGIYQEYAEGPGMLLALSYVTIYSNTANLDGVGGGDGGGVYMLSGEFALSSTILAANTALTSTSTADCGLAGGTATSGGYNLFGVASGCSNFAVASDMTTSDPQLDPLALNSPGSTPTHGPRVGSPPVDQIPDGVNGCGTTLTTDQRGVARPGGGACDIGAVERQNPNAVQVQRVTGKSTFPVWITVMALLLAGSIGLMVLGVWLVLRRKSGIDIKKG